MFCTRVKGLQFAAQVTKEADYLRLGARGWECKRVGYGVLTKWVKAWNFSHNKYEELSSNSQEMGFVRPRCVLC